MVEIKGSNIPAYREASSMPPCSSGFAIASVVLGLSGTILSWFVLGIPSVLAVIFGHIARNRIKRSDGHLTGRRMALTGLITGYLIIAAYVVAIFFIALPAYQDDTYRLRVSEAVFVATATRSAIETAYVRGARIGPDGNLPVEPSTLGLSTPHDGKYVKSVTYDATGRITVTMQDDAKLGPLSNRTVIFVPMSRGDGLVWQVSETSTVPKKYLPKN